MKKLMSLVLVLSLVIGGSALVFAYGGPGQMHGQGEYREQRNFASSRQNRINWEERLDLSDEQIDKLEKLRDEHFDKQDELRDRLEDKREEAREMYFDKEVSEAELVSVNKEINNLQSQLADLRMEHRLEIKNILTAEQLEEFEDFNRLGQRNSSIRGYGMRGSRGNGFRGRRGSCSGFGPKIRY